MTMSESVNILLIGESGVGKSTFINSFANYIRNKSLKATNKENLLCLIPTAFTLTNDELEEQIVHLGFPDETENIEVGDSSTQVCKDYDFQVGDYSIRLIDTPGVGDSRGIEQDEKNITNIMEHLENYPHLNAVCFLLKPNVSILGEYFKYCIDNLLKTVSNATRNLIFVFTCSRSTFYRPGETLRILEGLIKTHSLDIPLSKRNMFCLDNEAFRYAVAMQQGFEYSDAELEVFERSWRVSTESSRDILRYVIHELQPISRVPRITYFDSMVNLHEYIKAHGLRKYPRILDSDDVNEEVKNEMKGLSIPAMRLLIEKYLRSQLIKRKASEFEEENSGVSSKSRRTSEDPSQQNNPPSVPPKSTGESSVIRPSSRTMSHLESSSSNEVISNRQPGALLLLNHSSTSQSSLTAAPTLTAAHSGASTSREPLSNQSEGHGDSLIGESTNGTVSRNQTNQGSTDQASPISVAGGSSPSRELLSKNQIKGDIQNNPPLVPPKSGETSIKRPSSRPMSHLESSTPNEVISNQQSSSQPGASLLLNRSSTSQSSLTAAQTLIAAHSGPSTSREPLSNQSKGRGDSLIGESTNGTVSRNQTKNGSTDQTAALNSVAGGLASSSSRELLSNNQSKGDTQNNPPLVPPRSTGESSVIPASSRPMSRLESSSSNEVISNGQSSSQPGALSHRGASLPQNRSSTSQSFVTAAPTLSNRSKGHGDSLIGQLGNGRAKVSRNQMNQGRTNQTRAPNSVALHSVFSSPKEPKNQSTGLEEWVLVQPRSGTRKASRNQINQGSTNQIAVGGHSLLSFSRETKAPRSQINQSLRNQPAAPTSFGGHSISSSSRETKAVRKHINQSPTNQSAAPNSVAVHSASSSSRVTKASRNQINQGSKNQTAASTSVAGRSVPSSSRETKASRNINHGSTNRIAAPTSVRSFSRESLPNNQSNGRGDSSFPKSRTSRSSSRQTLNHEKKGFWAKIKRCFTSLLPW